MSSLGQDRVKQTFLMKRQTHHYVQSVPLNWPFFLPETARDDSRIELFSSVDTYEKIGREREIIQGFNDGTRS